MQLADYTRFVFAFAFVILLIWALASAVKRLGLDKKMRGAAGGKARLSTVDVLYLDPKRKLTLVRADDREYLLFIAGEHAQLIDRLGAVDDELVS